MRQIAIAWGMILVPAGLLTGCQRPSGDVDIGDQLPVSTQARGLNGVVLVTRVDDFVDCQMQDAAVALRAAHAVDGGVSSLTVLVVTRNTADTLAARRALERQRLAPRIEAVSPSEAMRVLDMSKVPAIYLVEDGIVVEEWEPDIDGRLQIQRDAIREALAQVARSGDQRSPEG